MRIGFRGELLDEPDIRIGFIGCGSHAFRNLFPTFQFTPVKLVATCDLDLGKAQAFAQQFGAPNAYADYREMLEREELDGVFMCLGYDASGRPLYPRLAIDCLQAGCHVWMEKPPAATLQDIEAMRHAADSANRKLMVGLKKMFYPANEKAYELMHLESFGEPQLVTLQYTQHIPLVEDFSAYGRGKKNDKVVSFLDHLCHPASLLIYLLGMPDSLFYERSPNGAGVAVFTYVTGQVATLTFTEGASPNGGIERTTITSNRARHITVENNHRVTLHHCGRLPYGQTPSFYGKGTDEASSLWEPELSLGQLYNKALFLLGYYGEINEFAQAILEERPLSKADLGHAANVTRIYEAFAQGPGKKIQI